MKRLQETAVGLVVAVFVGVAAACIPFQGPSPMPAPRKDPPSHLVIDACAEGERCIVWLVVRPGVTSHYRQGPWSPNNGRCAFYPEFGDVYYADVPQWLALKAPRSCSNPYPEDGAA